MNTDNGGKPYIMSASILGASFVLAAIVAGITFYQIRMGDNLITVTGSAKQAVMADSGKWTAGITRNVNISGLKSGYVQMDNDTKAVKEFLAGQGFKESDYTISPVFMNEDYSYNNSGANLPKQYNLTETLTLSSNDISKITAVAKSSASLASIGVVISTQALEYYYSKLPDLRVSLLSAAIADAKARAEKLAEAGGAKVGKLRNASSGVVQVIAPNSVDVSDYGSYDTSSVNKEVMITVKASFALN
ncbi:MAG: SIMPL domain-containing protein [Patescibacteria group bacterium]